MKPWKERDHDQQVLWRQRKKIVAHLGARLGDCAQVVDHVGFGHTDTGVADGENLALLVGDDADDKVLASVERSGVGEGGIADFVERIGCVRDQLAKEDLLVRVEGVCATSQTVFQRR